MTVEHEEPTGRIIIAVSEQLPAGASAVMGGDTTDIVEGVQTTEALHTIFENHGGLADDLMTAGVVLSEVHSGNDVVILLPTEEDASDLEEIIHPT